MRTTGLPYINSLMDTAVGLADQISRVIQKFFSKVTQKEVILHYLLGFLQFLLRRLKVELDIELLQKSGDGIGILIFL